MNKLIAKEYKASFDTITKVLTAGVIILFAFIGLRSGKALLVAQDNTTTLLINSGIIFFLLVTLVVSYLFSTQNYSIDQNELFINRPIGKRRISIENIAEIRPIGEGEMRGTIRIFGVAGFLVTMGNIATKHLA